jgi:predicted anti-sigma-YlaC factor YlaD
MNCQRCREALSARLDGEDPETAADVVDRHVARCPECRMWLARAEGLQRALRVGAAEPVPDLTAPILAASGARLRSRLAGTLGLLRISLLVMAGLQLWFALPGLALGQDDGAGTHVARELGAWQVALGVGFLAAALRPSRASGLLAVVGALGAGLLLTSGLDVVHGHASVLDEVPHLLTFPGLVFLWLIRPLDAGRPRRPAGGLRAHQRRVAF